MILRPLFLTTASLLLLAGCGSQAPDVSFRQPAPEVASGGTQNTDFTNEGMPKTTDSLEVVTGSGFADLVTSVSGGVLIGNASAPVLTMHTDYACEYCHEFATELQGQVEKTYIDPGLLSLRLVFVPRTTEGLFMTKVALCAQAQHLFRITDRQLVTHPIAADKDLPALAKKTGVNLKSLRSCIAKKPMEENIAATVTSAREAGITRVPAFELNGVAWLGVMETDELKATIEGALKR